MNMQTPDLYGLCVHIKTIGHIRTHRTHGPCQIRLPPMSATFPCEVASIGRQWIIMEIQRRLPVSLGMMEGTGGVWMWLRGWIMPPILPADDDSASNANDATHFSLEKLFRIILHYTVVDYGAVVYVSYNSLLLLAFEAFARFWEHLLCVAWNGIWR